MWFPRDAGEGAFPHDSGKGCFLKGPGEPVLSQGTREKGVFEGPWKMVFFRRTRVILVSNFYQYFCLFPVIRRGSLRFADDCFFDGKIARWSVPKRPLRDETDLGNHVKSKKSNPRYFLYGVAISASPGFPLFGSNMASYGQRGGGSMYVAGA